MIFDKLKYSFDIKYCKCSFNKNGKLLFIPNRLSEFWCILKNITYRISINLNELNGKNEDDIVNKLLILAYVKNKNIKYYNKNNIYVLINNNIKNIDTINTVANISDIYYKKTNNLMYIFLYYRIILSKKITNTDILIYIFYKYYINKKKLKELNINCDNISNYHELYLILKKKKIINYYYNELGKTITNNYKIIYNNIINSKYFHIYKNKTDKKFKNFKDINIFKIIDKYIKNSFDKKYIKEKLIMLSKKYKIKL